MANFALLHTKEVIFLLKTLLQSSKTSASKYNVQMSASKINIKITRVFNCEKNARINQQYIASHELKWTYAHKFSFFLKV